LPAHLSKRIFPVSALDNRRKARADELQLEDRASALKMELQPLL
jgi:hypothetical protein